MVGYREHNKQQCKANLRALKGGRATPSAAAQSIKWATRWVSRSTAQALASMTHFNTYYGSLAKPDTWFTGGRFLV